MLSKDDVEMIISNTKNKKHRLLLSLGCGSGLRVSEVVNLKSDDIDIKRKLIYVKQAKGNKNRITLLPDKLLDDMKENILIGKKYIFESERGGKLSVRTAQLIFKRALKKAGILKRATFRTLRHSFAIHLLKNGIDVRYVQELFGHQNIRTTQIYTHVTNMALRNIKSPL